MADTVKQANTTRWKLDPAHSSRSRWGGCGVEALPVIDAGCLGVSEHGILPAPTSGPRHLPGSASGVIGQGRPVRVVDISLGGTS